jgi:hypothetical protein
MYDEKELSSKTFPVWTTDIREVSTEISSGQRLHSASRMPTYTEEMKFKQFMIVWNANCWTYKPDVPTPSSFDCTYKHFKISPKWRSEESSWKPRAVHGYWAQDLKANFANCMERFICPYSRTTVPKTYTDKTFILRRSSNYSRHTIRRANVTLLLHSYFISPSNAYPAWFPSLQKSPEVASTLKRPRQRPSKFIIHSHSTI